MTTYHFEDFAPGMKAKLDPTYRRAFEEQRIPGRAEILGKMIRNSHKSVVPFTTKRNLLEISSRKF